MGALAPEGKFLQIDPLPYSGSVAIFTANRILFASVDISHASDVQLARIARSPATNSRESRPVLVLPLPPDAKQEFSCYEKPRLCSYLPM